MSEAQNFRPVTSYIPHRAPMLLVDRIIEITREKITSELTIKEDNIFFDSGLLIEPGLIEHMAQTSALHAGYWYKDEDKDAPVGFIGLIRDLKIYALPAAGSVIFTRSELTQRVLNANLSCGKVFCKDRLLAQCEMRIFEIWERKT
ncbi:MAG: hypothetical protein A2096_04855 [Spirochaetes bacterium GWF1_41_5]|nr:MAG: hypothetical protein A2096_04855 [Spirochaetes bacterium GWF1_41_5]HBE02690.1 hypothetical protein [Spirochaetia bacterium]